MSYFNLYMQPDDENPLSWASVRKNVQAVSDADFRSQFSKMAFKDKKRKKKKGKGLFSRLKSAFTAPEEEDSILRAPGEGASRPGFIRTAPQLQRPGFIAGLGTPSPSENAAAILSETKDKMSKLFLFLVVIGIFLYLKTRLYL